MNYTVRSWIILVLGLVLNSWRLSGAVPLPPITTSPALDFQVLLDPTEAKNAMKILNKKAYEAEGKYLAWSEKSKNLLEDVTQELETEEKYLPWDKAAEDLEDFTQELEVKLEELEMPLETMDLVKFRHQLEKLRLGKADLRQTKRNMNSAVEFIETVHSLQTLVQSGKFLQFSEIRSLMKTLWRLGLDIWKTRQERKEWVEVCFKVKEIRNVTLAVEMDFSVICFN